MSLVNYTSFFFFLKNNFLPIIIHCTTRYGRIINKLIALNEYGKYDFTILLLYIVKRVEIKLTARLFKLH